MNLTTSSPRINGDCSNNAANAELNALWTVSTIANQGLRDEVVAVIQAYMVELAEYGDAFSTVTAQATSWQQDSQATVTQTYEQNVANQAVSIAQCQDLYVNGTKILAMYYRAKDIIANQTSEIAGINAELGICQTQLANAQAEATDADDSISDDLFGTRAKSVWIASSVMTSILFACTVCCCRCVLRRRAKQHERSRVRELREEHRSMAQLTVIHGPNHADQHPRDIVRLADVNPQTCSTHNSVDKFEPPTPEPSIIPGSAPAPAPAILVAQNTTETSPEGQPTNQGTIAHLWTVLPGLESGTVPSHPTFVGMLRTNENSAPTPAITPTRTAATTPVPTSGPDFHQLKRAGFGENNGVSAKSIPYPTHAW